MMSCLQCISDRVFDPKTWAEQKFRIQPSSVTLGTRTCMYMMSPAKDLNSRSFFQTSARAFDHGSTQNLIFGPVGLQVFLQHFLEGFFEILIFSDLSGSFLSRTSRILGIQKSFSRKSLKTSE